jgi:phage shock protein A
MGWSKDVGSKVEGVWCSGASPVWFRAPIDMTMLVLFSLQMVAGLRINNDGAWAAFDKMEEKVVALEAEAEATGILATPDSVEQKFLALETGGVDDELAMLKKGMLTASSSGSSSSRRESEVSLGRPVSEVLVGNRVPMDAIDAELEQLRKRARQ